MKVKVGLGARFGLFCPSSDATDLKQTGIFCLEWRLYWISRLPFSSYFFPPVFTFSPSVLVKLFLVSLIVFLSNLSFLALIVTSLDFCLFCFLLVPNVLYHMQTCYSPCFFSPSFAGCSFTSCPGRLHIRFLCIKVSIVFFLYFCFLSSFPSFLLFFLHPFLFPSPSLSLYASNLHLPPPLSLSLVSSAFSSFPLFFLSYEPPWLNSA